MILAQLALLYICIRYRPNASPEALGLSTRYLSFWQWPAYVQYIEFLAAYMYVFHSSTEVERSVLWILISLPLPFHLPTSRHRIVMTILILIFGRWHVYVTVLGYLALGLESTLPLPQLYRLVVYSTL